MGKGGLRRTAMAGGSLEEYCGRIDVNGLLFRVCGKAEFRREKKRTNRRSWSHKNVASTQSGSIVVPGCAGSVRSNVGEGV